MTSLTGGTADCVRCETEQIERGEMPAWFRSFMVCATCGNKRCPHATWHENPCTGSNEPGQPGSAYTQGTSLLAETVRTTGVSVAEAAESLLRASALMPELPVPSRWASFKRWLRRLTRGERRGKEQP